MQLSPLAPTIIEFEWQKIASQAICDSLRGTRASYDSSLESMEAGIEPAVNINRKAKNAVLLNAGTGTGKMYMAARAIRAMLEAGDLALPPGSINPFPVLWLMPKSVKHQTRKVIHEFGLTRYVMLMSYSELKSSMGAMYITYIEAEDGSSKIPIWNLNMLPALVKCDEYQVLKNPNSLQSRVIRALPETVKTLAASATPFQRVVDATTFVERAACLTKYNPAIGINKTTSDKILSWIASPKSKNDYSPASVKRLRDAIGDYIVELKNVRFKHAARSKCITIWFKNPAERKAYDDLVQTLIDNLNARKGRDGGEFAYIHFLVEMQKMQQGAELLRVPHLVDRAIEVLPKKAVIIASNFVDTLKGCYAELRQRGIDESRIATVLGGQDMEERQAMIDDFQRGKRDILLFTIRSGGVGISLHHDRESTKPRHIILPPTWSAIDLSQALGRAHRITTISETVQEVLWYGGTIEDVVKVKVELKMKCLREAIIAKEQFTDVFAAQLVNVQIDQDRLAEIVEEDKHKNEDTESDDIGSNDDDSITGEGLDDKE
jgi:hypothetical protein